MQKRCYVVNDSTVAEHVAECLGITKRLNGAYRLKNSDTVTHINWVPLGGVPVDVWRDIHTPIGDFPTEHRRGRMARTSSGSSQAASCARRTLSSTRAARAILTNTLLTS